MDRLGRIPSDSMLLNRIVPFRFSGAPREPASIGSFPAANLCVKQTLGQAMGIEFISRLRIPIACRAETRKESGGYKSKIYDLSVGLLGGGCRIPEKKSGGVRRFGFEPLEPTQPGPQFAGLVI